MIVRIGPINYDVIEVAELNVGNTCGDINIMKCRIRIDADMHPDVKHVTLWHEIIHGILFAAGMTEHPEQVVDALAHGVVQVLRDNPHLIEKASVNPVEAMAVFIRNDELRIKKESS